MARLLQARFKAGVEIYLIMDDATQEITGLEVANPNRLPVEVEFLDQPTRQSVAPRLRLSDSGSVAFSPARRRKAQLFTDPDDPARQGYQRPGEWTLVARVNYRRVSGAGRV